MKLFLLVLLITNTLCFGAGKSAAADASAKNATQSASAVTATKPSSTASSTAAQSTNTSATISISKVTEGALYYHNTLTTDQEYLTNHNEQIALGIIDLAQKVNTGVITFDAILEERIKTFPAYAPASLKEALKIVVDLGNEGLKRYNERAKKSATASDQLDLNALGTTLKEIGAQWEKMEHDARAATPATKAASTSGESGGVAAPATAANTD